MIDKVDEQELKKKVKKSRKRVYDPVVEDMSADKEDYDNDVLISENDDAEKETPIKTKNAVEKKKPAIEAKTKSVKKEKTTSAKEADTNTETPNIKEETKTSAFDKTDNEKVKKESVVEEEEVSALSVNKDEAVSTEDMEKRNKAMIIIKKYTALSSTAALIPMPLVDLAASTGLQLKMLKDLCDLYEIPFSEHRGKALITTLISGYHVGLFAGSFAKLIPVISMAGAIASMFVLSGSVTYAVGLLFMYHFGKGGTLSDFDPEQQKEKFKKHFYEGKETLGQAV